MAFIDGEKYSEISHLISLARIEEWHIEEPDERFDNNNMLN